MLLKLSGSLLRGGSLFLQLIQQLEGLARGKFVGVQRGELLQQGVGGRRDGLGRAVFGHCIFWQAEHIHLWAVGGGLGFELFEVFLRGFEGGGGQAGEFGYGDAVAFFGRAGLDVV